MYQLKRQNYNPYQHAREEYIQTGKDIFESYRYTDCKIAKEWIDKYTNMYYSDTSTIRNTMDMVSWQVNCPEVIDFYIDVISKDTSERVRCDAILYLGWLRAEKSIPFLMEYIHNPISREKSSNRLNALCNEKYDLAINILDQFCYDENGIVIGDCIWSYYMAGSESAIKFFEYYFKKPESRLGAALKLAQLGVYDKTYPVFIEALKSGDTNKMHIALNGLAAIGDKKSMRLIKEHTKNKNQFIAKRAQNILNYIEMKRREKCDK